MAEDEFIAVEIRGIEDVCEALDSAPTILRGLAIVKGLRAGADVIEEFVTGAMIANIEEHTGKLLADLGSTVDVLTNGDDVSGVAMIGFSHDQGAIARWVEWGHRAIGHLPGKRDLGVVKPHPFMRPAADSGWEAAVDAFEEAAMQVLQDEGFIDAA